MIVAARSPQFDRGAMLAAGEKTPRDLPAARMAFEAAAAAGDLRGVHAYAGFLAGGIGGRRDWPGALDLLQSWSASDTIAARQIELIAAMDLTEQGEPRSTPPVRRVHPEKRIDLVSSFLTRDECEFFARIAGPRFVAAQVLTGGSTVDSRPNIRNNDVASFNPLEAPPFLHAVNRRIAAVTGTDIRQGEPIQVMRYGVGQEFKRHVDGVGGGANRRLLTAIIYLNDRYTGGETEFTELKIRVRGRPGDMIVFQNLTADGELDRDMRHAGLPVLSGVKFIASRWILQRPAYDDQGSLIGETLWS